MAVQNYSWLPRWSLSLAMWIAFVGLCTGIFLYLRESSIRKQKEIDDKFQRTLDSIFDDILENARKNQSDTIILSEYTSGIGADKKLKRIAALPQFRVVHLMQTDVTDEGILEIAKLPQLETLSLFSGNVTDKGMGCLANKPSIKKILIDQTGVSPQGIADLKTLPNLKCLICRRFVEVPISVSNEQRWIHAFGQLTQLESLKIDGNWVSENTIQSIQELLPHVKVARIDKEEWEYLWREAHGK